MTLPGPIKKALRPKIVFTNGVFDLIHPGHLYLLKNARALGDKLIVGVDSDKSVEKLGKTPKRPINNQEIRSQVLKAIRWVDEVIIFEGQNDLRDLLWRLKPDYLVKGGDYKADQIVGSDIIKTWGGKVKILPYLEGPSTTKLINQIRGL